MKIEIDLNTILGDEFGPETLEESIRRNVVEKLTATIKEGIAKKIDVAINESIRETLDAEIKAKLPSLINELLVTEYYPLDRYGSRSSQSTTFRKEVIKTIQEQMVYKPGQGSKNMFTDAVDRFMQETIAGLKGEWKKLIDNQLYQRALDEAIVHLRQKLNIST